MIFQPALSSLVLLSTVTAAASATVDIESGLDTDYDNFLIVGTGIVSALGGQLLARLKVNGAYQAGNYNRVAMQAMSTVGAVMFSGAAAGSDIEPCLAASTASTGALHLRCWIPRPGTAGLLKSICIEAHSYDMSAAGVSVATGYYTGGTQTLTGVRFYFPGGNVASGVFRLYGVK